jgi:hypothetical protein
MVEAIRRAPLSEEMRAALGDPVELVASLLVVMGGLALLAATGYGAVAEAIGAALLILGAAVSGFDVGTGITCLMDFYRRTETARTEEELDEAGKSFAGGVRHIGVGGLTLLLGLRGAAGRRAAPVRARLAADVEVVIPGPVNSKYGKVQYLLGKVPGNRSSAGKGRFFGGTLGFDDATLEPALRSHFLANRGSGITNAKGNFEVVGTMIGPNGRSANVVTVWRRDVLGVWQFVTAMPGPR